MLLNENIIKTVKDRFAHLQEQVKIIVFTQEFECQFCLVNRTLAEEITAASGRKIELEVYDFQKNLLEVEKYKIEQIPATVIMGRKDYGLRLYGIPGGYELSSLLEVILMISTRESGLSAETKKRLLAIDKPIRIKVMTTLTCPYCPQAVIMAQRLAIEHELIAAEMIDIGEFPHLANKYQVYGVPKVIINETTSFEGALPEAKFVDRLLQA